MAVLRGVLKKKPPKHTGHSASRHLSATAPAITRPMVSRADEYTALLYHRQWERPVFRKGARQGAVETQERG